ncbi:MULTISPECIES: ArgP/LysG family DNA-binding transcriptional regulator [unclassified Rathayibacter]|uniref:ArgP/LysG family DNA-binding transcriptional regulator n=1 Tax=unclassified Rathayibacter TaxID=2609250 RepID=UPI00188B6769|nr:MULTISPECIES: ArgP/LysG family DNA-binding transcriptional regulator [unclassified Rathayibacter]MBF4461331.1 ArgP/LysG family DNA-binding transcriptional regulator [Rathayibacter sp. VKM Ac-2879]MBF4502742.1 ArgP/LysG family DNA-binding transcriptional regulator [Rathayibacter sp. VKM Ac-2878]
MLSDDLDLPRLRALAAAVRHGSFDSAARALHITPSALSQRIKALESAAGRVLLVRARPVVATEAGAGLLRLARQIELLADDAVLALGTDVGEAGRAGPVVVPLAVNADSLATWTLPALASVPDVVVELHREDQEHTAAFLRDGTVLAAVTAEAEAVLGCTVERLGAMRYHAVAAPVFAERWFPGGDLRALAEAPLVVFDEKDRLQERFLRSAGVEGRPPQHRVPGSADFERAVRLGLGWGMLPELQAPPGGAGLVALGGAPVDVPLYWQRWSLHTPSLDAVTAAVTSAARAALRP